jgi:hypothetical protein
MYSKAREGAAAGWQQFTKASVSFAEYTADEVTKFSAQMGMQDHTKERSPPSAMDQATNGGPTTL